VWSLDVHSNGAKFERGYKGDGSNWEFVPPRVPFITSSSDSPTLIKLFAGHTICTDLEKDALFSRRISMQRFWEAGMRHICVTPIPPNPHLMLGLMIMAWKEAPPVENENAAIGAANLAAVILSPEG
jgi:hypothetical protein